VQSHEPRKPVARFTDTFGGNMNALNRNLRLRVTIAFGVALLGLVLHAYWSIRSRHFNVLGTVLPSLPYLMLAGAAFAAKTLVSRSLLIVILTGLVATDVYFGSWWLGSTDAILGDAFLWIFESVVALPLCIVVIAFGCVKVAPNHSREPQRAEPRSVH
jgi:hypothetical protein